MVSGVSQGMGVLDGMVIVKGEGAVLGLNLRRPVVTNGEFAMWIFPNYFGQYSLNVKRQSLAITDLVCKSACEEWNEILGVDLDETFEMRLDKVDVVLFFCDLRQMLRINSVALCSSTPSSSSQWLD